MMRLLNDASTFLIRDATGKVEYDKEYRTANKAWDEKRIRQQQRSLRSWLREYEIRTDREMHMGNLLLREEAWVETAHWVAGRMLEEVPRRKMWERVRGGRARGTLEFWDCNGEPLRIGVSAMSRFWPGLGLDEGEAEWWMVDAVVRRVGEGVWLVFLAVVVGWILVWCFGRTGKGRGRKGKEVKEGRRPKVPRGKPLGLEQGKAVEEVIFPSVPTGKLLAVAQGPPNSGSKLKRSVV